MKARWIGQTLRKHWLLLLIAVPLWLCTLTTRPSLAVIATCCAVACLLAVYDHPLELYLKEQVKLRRGGAVVIGLGAAWLLVGESLEAQWWIIDDHEIADALAVGKVRTPLGLWRIFASHIEIGAPPMDYPRYRPSYYILRYVECFLWGFEPARWYFFRFLMFAAAIALCWNALFTVTGPSIATVTTLYLLTYPFWVDVWGRLGPAEQYAVLGTSLFVAGATAVARRMLLGLSSHYLHWLAASVGAALACGSKENFVFLPGLLGALFVLALWRRAIQRAAIGTVVLTLLYATWIGAVVFISIRTRGASVYGGSSSMEPRLLFVGAADLWTQTNPYLWVATVGLIAIAVLRSSIGAWSRLSVFVFTTLICFAIYSSQVLFYSGTLPVGMRYDFPATLIAPIVLSLAAGAIRREVHATLGTPSLTMATSAAVLVAATLFICEGTFGPLRAGIAGNVARTKAFTAELQRIQAAVKREPKRPILFATANAARDYEPIVSVRLFLRYYKVRNHMFVAKPGGHDALAKTVKTWSKKGEKEWLGLRAAHLKRVRSFFPLARLAKESASPFGLGFSQGPPEGTIPLGMYSW